MKSKISLLLVDEDEKEFIATKKVLDKTSGLKEYHLEWISPGENALNAIGSGKYDVCLVDYHYALSTGLPMIRKTLEETNNFAVILLSKNYPEKITDHIAEAGAAFYLDKDILTPDRLERAIHYAMRYSGNIINIRKLNAEHAKAMEALADTNYSLEISLEEKSKLETELRESQRLYIAMAKNFPSGIIGILNRSLCFEMLHGKELNAYGIEPNEFKGSSIKNKFPEVFPELETYLDAAFKGVQQHFEMEYAHRIYLVNIVPLATLKGDIPQLLIVTTNISEQKKASEKLQVAFEKEKELNELKSRFVTMASHEFRTPLSTILSSVELISKYDVTGDAEKKDKHIKRIKSSIANLTEILNDFLSLEKLEGGKVELSISEFNLPGLMEEIINEFQSIVKKGQKIHHRHKNQDNTALVKNDKKLVKNISINLLSNAIKYSPEEKPIFIETEIKNKNIFIRVEDKGIGIPYADQKKLFDRFFRAENATNIQGTGLGLSIVKKYVDLMNGEISFTSKPGEGSVFTVCLPDDNQILSQH